MHCAACSGLIEAAVQRVPGVLSIRVSASIHRAALLPCGLLQSACVVAALSSHAAGGAAVMIVFSLCSAPGLLAAPLLGAAWHRRRDDPSWRSRLVIMTRLSGLLLALASAWALGHGLWTQVFNVC